MIVADKKISRNKQLFIDALHGAGVGHWDHAERMRRAGLARSSGNQHNEDYAWIATSLVNLSDDALLSLYVNVKKSWEKSE